MKSIITLIFTFVLFVELCNSFHKDFNNFQNVNILSSIEQFISVQEDNRSTAGRDKSLYLRDQSKKLWHINKCCDEDEVFDSNGYTCAKNIASGKDDWFPIELFHSTQLDHIDPVYGRREPCHVFESRTVSWHHQDKYAMFRVERGLLKEFYKSNNRLRGEFPPSEYCLDKTSSTQRYVARFCPCKMLLCIRKCCVSGYMLSLARNECVKNKSNTDTWLKFYSSNQKPLKEAPPYYLLHELPKCNTLGHQVLHSQNGEVQFYLQEDGSMSVRNEVNEIMRLNKEQYCVDMSHSPQSTGLTLLLCQDRELNNENNNLANIVISTLEIVVCFQFICLAYGYGIYG